MNIYSEDQARFIDRARAEAKNNEFVYELMTLIARTIYVDHGGIEEIEVDDVDFYDLHREDVQLIDALILATTFADIDRKKGEE